MDGFARPLSDSVACVYSRLPDHSDRSTATACDRIRVHRAKGLSWLGAGPDRGNGSRPFERWAPADRAPVSSRPPNKQEIYPVYRKSHAILW